MPSASGGTASPGPGDQSAVRDESEASSILDCSPGLSAKDRQRRVLSETSISVYQQADHQVKFRKYVRRYLKKVSFSPEPEAALSVPQISPINDTVDARSAPDVQDLEGICEAAQHVDPGEKLVRSVSFTDSQHMIQINGHDGNRESLAFKPLFEAMGPATNIDRKTTLKLAITATASVLQLHDTRWLSDNWSNKDLMVPSVQADMDGGVIYQPYLCRTLGQPHEFSVTANTAAPLLIPQVRNMGLFSLAVALIELWFGQTLEELRLSEEMNIASSTETPTVAWKMITASRLIDCVYRQAGDWYGDAVRRCLYCEFNQRQTELKHSSMKEAVYSDVFIPLTEHLKALGGGRLGETRLAFPEGLF